jgi:hypothetical protein
MMVFEITSLRPLRRMRGGRVRSEEIDGGSAERWSMRLRIDSSSGAVLQLTALNASGPKCYASIPDRPAGASRDRAGGVEPADRMSELMVN